MDTTMSVPSTSSEISFYGNSGLQGIGKDPRKVASLFESLFYRELLRASREEEDEDPVFGSNQMSTTRDMYDDEISTQMGSMNRLGIAEIVLKEINDKANREFPLGLVKGEGLR